MTKTYLSAILGGSIGLKRMLYLETCRWANSHCSAIAAVHEMVLMDGLREDFCRRAGHRLCKLNL